MNWQAPISFSPEHWIFFLSYSHIWSLTYFGCILYLGLSFLAQTYLVANLKDFTTYNTTVSNNTPFSYNTGFDLIKFFFFPIFIFLCLNFSWTSPSLLVWFGHLYLTPLQYKIFFWLLTWFAAVLLVQLTSFYFTGTDVYDYMIVQYFFLMWLLLLFYTTNLFSFIFFIEILSILIMLLLVTSTFSTTYFFTITNFTSHSYFQQTLPFAFLQTLLFFFWVSLIGSLTLFVFLLLFYLKFVTFEWFLVEVIFYYLTSASSLKDLYSIALIWFLFLVSIFLKCGLAPFYFWKPTFFKGISFHALFVYIAFFYFFLIIYFSYLLSILLSDVFYFNIFVNLILVLLGLSLLVFILFESYYIKAFFALSSIINTLLVFLSLSAVNFFDFVFVL